MDAEVDQQFQPDLNCVFVGRDVFGRFSLVFAQEADNIIISDLTQTSPLLCSKTSWNEVPYAQVCSIDTRSNSALLHSYLPSYPEGVLEPWSAIFDSFCFESVPTKDSLIKVSRTTDWPGSNHLDEFLKKLVDATRSMIPTGSECIAVAFSGGVDSLLVAVATHLAYASERRIDLVNVAFIRSSEVDSSHRSVVTDRKRAIAGFTFLRSKYPDRKWRLILADVTQEEMEKHRSEHVVRAAAPALSVLDESLACVLWFALRGFGRNYDNDEEIRSQARIYFVGSGADELFAGYARHRTRFERDGAGSIPEECEAELCRLGSRNGGRDARVAAVLGKELRAPFLHDDFVAWANCLPMQLKCDLSLPRGKGEKLILRQVLAELGAPHDAPKQAMQFGSGFVKMQNNKALKGSDISSVLLEYQDGDCVRE
ncbi:asparagine synthase [Ancylostoma caninum]|uniref:Asparagine synthase n=1 Tax=Ancylostoma caninum TaxID=29170 RepID=A0A368H573_ANCCA|nr:asparagine synthase [Ancylostoma caninum]